MPEIYKPKKKSTVKHSDNKIVASLRSSSNWQKLRDAYFQEHPLCEKCLENGIVKETEEIHHITPIAKGKDLAEMKGLAYNPDNLMALCKECHDKIHNSAPFSIPEDLRRALNI